MRLWARATHGKLTTHIPLGGSVGCVDDLRAVLRIFNEFNIPVWTVSRGKNLGYGAAAPVVPGCVVLDLHRINKIIEVNEKLAYAVVEPGVTFTDLYHYCVERKLKVWPSTASLGWGSVIGNVCAFGSPGRSSTLHYSSSVLTTKGP